MLGFKRSSSYNYSQMCSSYFVPSNIVSQHVDSECSAHTFRSCLITVSRTGRFKSVATDPGRPFTIPCQKPHSFPDEIKRDIPLGSNN